MMSLSGDRGLSTSGLPLPLHASAQSGFSIAVSGCARPGQSTGFVMMEGNISEAHWHDVDLFTILSQVPRSWHLILFSLSYCCHWGRIGTRRELVKNWSSLSCLQSPTSWFICCNFLTFAIRSLARSGLACFVASGMHLGSFLFLRTAMSHAPMPFACAV